MFCLLHRYGLVTALLIGFTRVCVAAEYAYQGADYSWVPGGTQFSLTDSTSGTLTINNPPWGGVCTGLGSGAGECDITNFELTSSGSPPLSLDLSVIRLVFFWAFLAVSSFAKPLERRNPTPKRNWNPNLKILLAIKPKSANIL